MTQPLPALASTVTAPDRLKSNIERLFSLLLPFMSYMVRWEYTVVAVTPPLPGVPGTVDGVPVDATRCPFGPLTGIALWKGPSGSPSVPPVGSRVLVEFHDGNPAKPAVCGLDPTVPILPPGLSVASALTTFATGLNPGTLVAQAGALVTELAPLL